MTGNIEQRPGRKAAPRTSSDGHTPAFVLDGGGDAARLPATPAIASQPAIDPARVLVICNPRSHRNKRAGGLPLPDGFAAETPRTRDDLAALLSRRSDAGLDLVVIAGGDGTVRDALSCGGDIWERDGAPAIAFLPRGKTNALALDLGVPDEWDVADAIAAFAKGQTTPRPPIEVTREDGLSEPVRGFLFGAGIFVDATDLAQTTHKWGAFNSLAVGLSMGWVMLKVLFGGNKTRWRTGYRMTVDPGPDAQTRLGALPPREGSRFLAFISTMENMPLGLTPLGPPRPGMKALIMAAPPRRFAWAAPQIARGSTDPKLARLGIHRFDTRAMFVDLEGGFVLDGERFDAGRYALREGRPISFVTP